MDTKSRDTEEAGMKCEFGYLSFSNRYWGIKCSLFLSFSSNFFATALLCWLQKAIGPVPEQLQALVQRTPYERSSRKVGIEPSPHAQYRRKWSENQSGWACHRGNQLKWPIVKTKKTQAIDPKAESHRVPFVLVFEKYLQTEINKEDSSGVGHSSILL